MSLLAFDVWNLVFSAIVAVLLQVFMFGVAAGLKTDKVTDLTYGLTFAILSGCYLFYPDDIPLRQWFIQGAIIVWGLRLAAYLFIRIMKTGTDDRFDEWREKPLSLAKFWTFQAIVIWLVILPASITAAAPSPSKLVWTDWVGLALFIIGFGIEAVADQQKFSFKNQPANKSDFIQSGLWKYSRHPNYFGEVLLWWGIFILAAADLHGGMWLAVMSPVCITFILLKVSGIPLLEESADKKYGDRTDYQDYKKRTPVFFLRPPKTG